MALYPHSLLSCTLLYRRLRLQDGISGREDTTDENVIMKLKSLIKDINQNAVTEDEV